MDQHDNYKKGAETPSSHFTDCLRYMYYTSGKAYGKQLYLEMVHGKFMNKHYEMAKDKVWLTQQGEEIPYKQLTDKHLDAIIILLEKRVTNRSPHYKGIIEEKIQRTTVSGKLLYG